MDRLISLDLRHLDNKKPPDGESGGFNSRLMELTLPLDASV